MPVVARRAALVLVLAASLWSADASAQRWEIDAGAGPAAGGSVYLAVASTPLFRVTSFLECGPRVGVFGVTGPGAWGLSVDAVLRIPFEPMYFGVVF
jgi:hypothetical protein